VKALPLSPGCERLAVDLRRRQRTICDSEGAIRLTCASQAQAGAGGPDDGPPVCGVGRSGSGRVELPRLRFLAGASRACAGGATSPRREFSSRNTSSRPRTAMRVLRASGLKAGQVGATR